MVRWLRIAGLSVTCGWIAGVIVVYLWLCVQ